VVIHLSGWSPDRYPQVLSLMLQEARLPPASGVFTFSGFAPDEELTQEQEAAISSYFKPMTLEECRSAKRSEIAAARWTAMSTPTTVDGFSALWYADKESMNDMLRASIDLQTAIAMEILPPETTVEWKTASGDFVTLTLENLINVRMLLSQRQQALYAQEAALVGLIDSATTPAELEAIAWTD